MTDLFFLILENSFYGSIVIAIILGLRLVLKKAPRSVICFLWILAALRLVCPYTIESSLSLQPTREELSSAPIQFLPQEEQTQQNVAVNPGDYGSGTQVEQNQEPLRPVTPNQSQTATPNTNTSINGDTDSQTPTITTMPDTEPDYAAIAAWLWITGMAIMAGYTTVSYLRLKRRVKDSYVLGQDLFLCPGLDSAFVLGFFKPQIFLPEGLSEESQRYVVAHERAHIDRKDHIWKLVGFAVLTLHWFNPLVWVAYNLLCKDIEMACDERVVRDMDVAQRKAYSTALLACAAKRSGISACPVAFGETGVKQRIVNVLNYRKPGFWITLVAVVAAIAVAVCFLTSPKSADEIERCEEALNRWQTMKTYHLHTKTTSSGNYVLNDNATADFWVEGENRIRRTVIELDSQLEECWYRYQDGEESYCNIWVDYEENKESDTGWIGEQPDADIQTVTIPWIMGLDWNSCEIVLDSYEQGENGGELIRLSVLQPDGDPKSYSLHFKLDANGDLDTLTLVYTESGDDAEVGVLSSVCTMVMEMEDYEPTESTDAQIPEGMADLSRMIEGSEIQVTVNRDQILLSEDGLTVTLSVDSGLVYRNGFVMAVMKQSPRIAGEIILVDAAFNDDFLCKDNDLSDGEELQEPSLFHGVMFFADEILVALEQPDASAFNQKLLDEILLPGSMGIEAPHVEMDRAFQSQLLSGYSAELVQELEGLGYENAASYTYTEYVILSGAQTLEQAGISSVPYDGNMTVAEYHRQLQVNDRQEFVEALTDAELEFAEQRQIELDDLSYLDRLYPGAYMSRSDEVLKTALEEYYAADISYLQGMADANTGREEYRRVDEKTADELTALFTNQDSWYYKALLDNYVNPEFMDPGYFFITGMNGEREYPSEAELRSIYRENWYMASVHRIDRTDASEAMAQVFGISMEDLVHPRGYDLSFDYYEQMDAYLVQEYYYDKLPLITIRLIVENEDGTIGIYYDATDRPTQIVTVYRNGADWNIRSNLLLDDARTYATDLSNQEIPWQTGVHLSYDEYFGIRRFYASKDRINHTVWSWTYDVEPDGARWVVRQNAQSNDLRDNPVVWWIDGVGSSSEILFATPDYIFALRDGTELCRVDYRGNWEVLMTDETGILEDYYSISSGYKIDVMDEVFFFVAGIADQPGEYGIYRCYVPTGQIDLVFDEVNQEWGRPVLAEPASNFQIYWEQQNEEYWEYYWSMVDDPTSVLYTDPKYADYSLDQELIPALILAADLGVDAYISCGYDAGTRVYSETPSGKYLTEEQQEELLHDFNERFGKSNSWYNRMLTCTYESPEDISLECIFYNGFVEESGEMTEQELEELSAYMPWYSHGNTPFELIRLPIDRMNTILDEYFGVTLEDLSQENFDGLIYLESTNCYYMMHNDANGLDNFFAASVEELSDGTLLMYYVAGASDGTPLENYVAALLPYNGGYRILYNLEYAS